ncbi:hypothetical protein VNI00_012013 [Paramarasmius palmivorus]|uniref:Pyroglutamyl-peptidase I n=1 Tax=Paramarasmius palmivorus TaxID=297713 RepID=A0AAW0C912_9AGAR
MPQISRSEEDVFHVLLTGFGVRIFVLGSIYTLELINTLQSQPFRNYKVNPSWLAVKPLHNTIIPLDPYPVVIDGQVVNRNAEESGGRNRVVKVSALEIPMEYEAVMRTVPGLHLRPPQLPDTVNKDDFFSLPEGKGYDFIFHLGVAGQGALRMEQVAHKLGYQMKDATGRLAPIVTRHPGEFAGAPGRNDDEEVVDVSVGAVVPSGPSVSNAGFGNVGGSGLNGGADRDRLSGLEMIESAARPNRGFGVGYEKFTDDLYTDIDVSRLIHDLRESGIDQVYSSMDAGHYLCDFMYYCSLAESKRNGKPYEKDRNTQVLFVHVPPVGLPLTTEQCTEAVRRIIQWVGGELAELHDLQHLR